MQETGNMTESPFIELCSMRRKEIKEIAQRVLYLKSHSSLSEKGTESYLGQRPEEIENIMLAYRHLEDAAMRLGKVIQAADGGTSVYDK